MQNAKSIIGLNLEHVRNRLADACRRSGRRPESVTLVGVTKSVGVQEARALAELGLRNLGENRVQDVVEKTGALSHDFPELRWHLIGNLQTNKIKYCIEKCYLIHAIDSLHLAEAVNREAEKRGAHVNALIEVNIAGENTKHGLKPEELPAFLEKALELPEIEWRGLMTMAPFYQNPQETRPVFAELRRLLEENGRRFGNSNIFRELSMGMTNDFEIAVEEGATLVRVGTALFGGVAL